MDSIVKQLKQFKADAIYEKKKHYNAAERKRRYYRILSFIQIFLNAITGTTLLTVVFGKGSKMAEIIALILTIIATILASIQKICDYEKQAQGNAKAADMYLRISKKISLTYLLSGDDCRMGTVFPGNNSISDILLLCFREIRKKIEKGQWKTGLDETCLIDQIEFENMIKEMKQEYGSGFSKNYREMPEGEFVKSVLDEMKLWMFIRKEELAHQIKICPLTGKIQGSYPEDYMGGRNDE